MVLIRKIAENIVIPVTNLIMQMTETETWSHWLKSSRWQKPDVQDDAEEDGVKLNDVIEKPVAGVGWYIGKYFQNCFPIVRFLALHVVVGNNVDVDAAVGLEADGNDHGQEIKDGVFALVDDFPTLKDVILV